MKTTRFSKSDKKGRHGRKRGTARLFVLGAAFAAATSGSGTSAAQAQTPPAQSAAAVVFSIQPGPVSDVIAAFQTATGTRVSLALDSIGQIQSPGVVGRMTPERALQTLLAGTSLAFRTTAPA